MLLDNDKLDQLHWDHAKEVYAAGGVAVSITWSFTSYTVTMVYILV